MSLALTFTSQMHKLIDLLGTPLEYTHGSMTENVTGAVVPFGRGDESLINSIGIEGRKLYLKNVIHTPKKFDTFKETVSGVTYSVYDVHPAVVDGKLIGYFCLVKA